MASASSLSEPADPELKKAYNALSDYIASEQSRSGQAAQAHAYATINAMASLMSQAMKAKSGGVGPGMEPPVPLTPRRSGRQLLGRGVEPTREGHQQLPPPFLPRTYSDSRLLAGPRGGYGGRYWDPPAHGMPYTESLARFSMVTPPNGSGGMGSGGRYGGRMMPPPGMFPTPPDAYGDLEDGGFDDILNNRAMLAAANAVGGTYPPRSNIHRSKMVYYLKFGEQGQEPGKFSEPSGVAVSATGDLIVADTNNHRIQVFHANGRFKFSFGECGKRDGQLLYPNRVTVNQKTGDIVITERSPTHQIQVFNQYGQFLTKFGATILQHPRGVCVDSKGRIIVVECKVMRVLIFEMGGALVGRFDCSAHLEFPNGVCASEAEEIYVSDNRAHAVKVFDYTGRHLRTIGGEGITNFPIGVGINHLGQVVIADNHNNFNVTVFDRAGQLLYGLESKVKHAQCFDVALIEDGSVALASKDYRLYLYRYALPSAPATPPASPANNDA